VGNQCSSVTSLIETRKIAKADFLKYFLEQYKNVIRIWGLKIFIILDDRAFIAS
jgi:hypothetical protein